MPASMDDIYFESRCIILRVFAQKNDFPQTSNSLPKIELPKVDSNVKGWHSFHDTFLSLVHDNFVITDIQRFHYLLTCVTYSKVDTVIYRKP